LSSRGVLRRSSRECRPGAEISPKSEYRVKRALEGVPLNGPLAGGKSQLAAPIGVGEQGIDRTGQRPRILGRDQHARSRES
jgi:hypothetical protein